MQRPAVMEQETHILLLLAHERLVATVPFGFALEAGSSFQGFEFVETDSVLYCSIL